MGAGKTTVGKKFRDLGAVVIDADELAREAIAPDGDAFAATVEYFGEGILDINGLIDRQKLADIVFHDETKRLKLESVVHPVVAQKRSERLAGLAPETLVIEDIPLLTEKGLASGYQQVIVVVAPLEARIERVKTSRGLTAEQVLDRFSTQATDEQRLAIADFVIDNSGDEAALDAQVREIWQRLRHLAPQ
jgi:dephospho-CoA kinase